MSAKKIVAGNWKMNKTLNDGLSLISSVIEGDLPSDVLVIFGTPYIHLNEAKKLVGNKPNIGIAAQNCHHEDKGAYSGEISIEMLKSIGIEYVIVGHSERRQYFGETDQLVGIKVKKCLDNAITPIYCCGESLEIRESGNHISFVLNQLQESLGSLSNDEIQKVVIAYEPIWAIGTGKTASPEEAQEIHAAIRNHLSSSFNPSIANNISILYGGSCNANNANTLFTKPDVDGGLIGGASLIVEDFLKIINSY